METVRNLTIYLLNGLLVLSYTALEHLAPILAGMAMGWLLWKAPSHQRPWLGVAAILAVVAALLAPAPVPLILWVMCAAGALASSLDRFNPDALRWRISGGIVLYALAALAYLAYGRYLSGLDAAAWAEAIGGQEEALATLAQGRAFVNTLATWGLWLIIPMGYFSLLAQGLWAHPPTPGRPEEIIARVRTRGEAKDRR